MIFWSIVPEDVVFNGWEDTVEFQELSYMGKTVRIRRGAGGGSLEQLLSTDPKDFLKKELSPGSQVPFSL